MTPLQTLLDERAKEFDGGFVDRSLPFEVLGPTKAISVKAFLQESILQGVRLGLAMGRECMPERDYDMVHTKEEAARRLGWNEHLEQTLAALEAKEKEI